MEGSIAGRFQSLTIWSRGDERAPNKPLLALWALGQCLRGEPRLLPYSVVEKQLRMLIKQFGRPKKRIHTEAPFWRMQGDGVWEIDRPQLVRTTSKGDAWTSDLRRHDIRGGLTESDYAAFRSHPGLALQVGHELVTAHFPSTLHIEILEATSILEGVTHLNDVAGQEHWVTSRRRSRDAKFRREVLSAYGSQCAVCGFAGRFRDDSRPLALEAAHIKWHEAKGPNVVRNGLSLCVLHHELFDKGAFTILPELSVVVADVVEGAGVESALGRYHRKPLGALPLEGYPLPGPEFLTWHREEVFRAPQ